jgi:hypothetical protein
MKVAVLEVTEENRDDLDGLVNLALSMYLGERCKFCDKQYATLDDLKDTVWAGYHEHGRLACKRCWDEDQTYRKSLDNEAMQKVHELGQ